MAITKKSLSDFEHARLKEVLKAAGDDLAKVPDAVKNAMHGVKDRGARYRLTLALTDSATRAIQAHLRNAKVPPKDNQLLKDLRYLQRGARENKNFFDSRLTPDDD